MKSLESTARFVLGGFLGLHKRHEGFEEEDENEEESHTALGAPQKLKISHADLRCREISSPAASP
jgi:hypothetical protein